MVPSPDKKALYAIGGEDGSSWTNDIFKFNCYGNIDTCRWTKSETTLRFGRYSFVAIPIPKSLAENLCATDQTTVKPPEQTTDKPINPTTTTNQINPCDYFNDYIGDGYCEDETNLAECNHDGGDCCGDDVNTVFCKECICHPINPTTTTDPKTTADPTETTD